MPRNARYLLGESFIHNMVQGINREFIFEKITEKEKYLSLLKKYSKKYEISVIAYCIMDNHTHLLTYSKDIKDVSLFMKDANTEYATYYNKIKKRVGYVFRNRFSSKIIYNEKHLYTCIKYIHMNPVKAKIVKSEEEYKFSSYNDYLNQENFINSEIINLIFHSNKNYLEKFQSIKYQTMNLEKEKINIKEAYNQYLKENKINICNADFIITFMKYLEENEYDFTKSEIAKVLEISRATLYRRLKK